MSLYNFNSKAFLKQIKLNAKENQIEWQPHQLENNIFELAGISRQIFGFYKLVGNPIKIKEDPLTFAWKFVNNVQEYKEFEKAEEVIEVLAK